MCWFKKFFIIKILSLAILIMLGCSCMQYSKDKRESNDIKAIRLFFNWQLISTNDFTVTNFGDSINIYYHKDMVLYQIGHPYDIRKATFDTSGNISNVNVTQEGIRYSYFVYKKNDLYGFKYDSITAQTGHRFLADSFLRAKLSYNEEIFVNSNDSLIETKKDEKNNSLYEKYIPKIKYDDTYADSSYYYYTNKMKDIDYSFSKKIDQRKNMKLYKITFVYNPYRSSQYSHDMPRREFLFEIKEIPVVNPKEILTFFEKHLKADIQY